jgi:hypothetical protein
VFVCGFSRSRKEDQMNSLASPTVPDSFALTDAARRHRAACLGNAFTSAIGWVEAMTKDILHRVTTSMTPAIAMRRHSTH